MQQLRFQIQNTTVQIILEANIDSLLNGMEHCVIVTDELVNQLHGEKWVGCKVLTVPQGESAKTKEIAFEMLEQMLQWQITTEHTIIGIGGGVVTDLAGFLASIYKRGLPLILVPTTLLAMVDAALGGKNGVNAGAYKNMVGTLYQPCQIWYDFNFLSTLPHEEWVNGMAEIIKHGWIADNDLLLELEQTDWLAIKKDPLFLTDLVKRNIEIKLGIVIKDPSDKNERKWLNFGHTLAHAIERQQAIPHGKAVAIGMLAVMYFSKELNDWDETPIIRMRHLLAKYELPINIHLTAEEIYHAMVQDKKRSAGHLTFVLLKEPGKPYLHKIPLAEIKETVSKMLVWIYS